MFEQKIVIKQTLKLNRFKELQAQLKESRVSILDSEDVGYGEVTEIIFLPKKLEVRVKTVSKTLDLSRHTFVCTNGVWSLIEQQSSASPKNADNVGRGFTSPTIWY